jgi:hypothetical protein
MNGHLHTERADRQTRRRRRGSRARGKRERDPTPVQTPQRGRVAQLPIVAPSPYDTRRDCLDSRGWSA